MRSLAPSAAASYALPLLCLAALWTPSLAARPLNVSGGVELRWTELESLGRDTGYYPTGSMFDARPHKRVLYVILTSDEDDNLKDLLAYSEDKGWHYPFPWPVAGRVGDPCMWGAVVGQRLTLFTDSNGAIIDVDQNQTVSSAVDFKDKCRQSCAVREALVDEKTKEILRAAQIWCFGGRPTSPPGRPAPAPHNQLRRLTLESESTRNNRRDRWEVTDIAGEHPPARVDHAASVSPDGRTLYIFGGTQEDNVPLFDMWGFDITDGQWTHLYDVPPQVGMPTFAVMKFGTRLLIGMRGADLEYEVEALLLDENASVTRPTLSTVLTDSPPIDSSEHPLLVNYFENRALLMCVNYSLWRLEVVMPEVVGTCTPGSREPPFGISCDTKQCTDQRCLGLAAGVRGNSTSDLCLEGSFCDKWQTLKKGMKFIYEVTLVDITADVVNVIVVLAMFAAMFGGGLQSWPKLRRSALALSWICFMLDVTAQLLVIITARDLQRFEFGTSNCFSVGVGNSIMVKVDDLLGDTSTFGVIMLAIALMGGIAEAADGLGCCAGTGGHGESRQALINVLTLAVLELSLGMVDLVANQIELVAGLEEIERAVKNIGYFGTDASDSESFSCTMLAGSFESHGLPFEIQPKNWVTYALTTTVILFVWSFFWMFVMECCLGIGDDFSDMRSRGGGIGSALRGSLKLVGEPVIGSAGRTLTSGGGSRQGEDHDPVEMAILDVLSGSSGGAIRFDAERAQRQQRSTIGSDMEPFGSSARLPEGYSEADQQQARRGGRNQRFIPEKHAEELRALSTALRDRPQQAAEVADQLARLAGRLEQQPQTGGRRGGRQRG